MTIYKVKNGDTLSDIAKKHETTVSAIVKANPVIKNADVICAGWVLEIPAAPVTVEVLKKQYVAAIKDIQKLSSVQKLISMLEG